MFRMVIFFLGFSLAAATPALADYYKWTDKDGVTHYGETPPEQHRQDAVQYKGIRQAKPGRFKMPTTMKMAPTDPALAGQQLHADRSPATPVLIEQNAVIVPVTFKSTFGKVVTANMLLDTGANITVIHADTAHRAGAQVQWGGMCGWPVVVC